MNEGHTTMTRYIFGLLIGFLILLFMGTIQPTYAKPDYKKMVDQIESYLDESVRLYRKGDIQKAKKKAQASYFEIFENLEGPIRINVSAKKGYELEAEFGTIRKMIIQKKPIAEVEKTVSALIKELRKILPELGNYQLVAEKSEGHEPEKKTTTQKKKETTQINNATHPEWLAVWKKIESSMKKATSIYQIKDLAIAKQWVRDAQFEGYKNSMMETAVRRYISSKKDYDNNSGFADIIQMMKQGKSKSLIEAKASTLLASLKNDLKGLPRLDGPRYKQRPTNHMNAGHKNMNHGDMAGNKGKNWASAKTKLISALTKAIQTYHSGKTAKAIEMIQDSYFDIFEASGMEAGIGARDSQFKVKLEGYFNKMSGQVNKGVPVSQLKTTLSELEGELTKAVKILSKKGDSPIASFFYSLMIILREGFEAILIITAILAYLIKTGNQDKVKVIYNACFVAIVLSLITAALVKWVFHSYTAGKELLEGVTMLLASVVLFSISYWLISKAEAEKWTAYIKGQLNKSLSSGSLKALWFTAFLAVYREGAETVLFYQALTSSASASGNLMILAGFLVGSVLLGIIYFVMKTGANKLPIRPFFIITGSLLYYMAFVFAGKGMMELVEAKVIQPALVSGISSVPFLGIYPYWQTLTPQIGLVLAAILSLLMILKSRKLSQEIVEAK